MSVKWIDRNKWDWMLHRSQSMLNAALNYQRVGKDADAALIWKELAPLNRRIRSPLLRVRGIDERPTP